MKLGLNIGYWGLVSGKDNIDMVLEAERLGYSVAWCAEAYGNDAATVLTWIAAKTSKIHVGSAILQIPARSPARSATAGWRSSTTRSSPRSRWSRSAPAWSARAEPTRPSTSYRLSPWWSVTTWRRVLIRSAATPRSTSVAWARGSRTSTTG